MEKTLCTLQITVTKPLSVSRQELAFSRPCDPRGLRSSPCHKSSRCETRLEGSPLCLPAACLPVLPELLLSHGRGRARLVQAELGGGQKAGGKFLRSVWSWPCSGQLAGGFRGEGAWRGPAGRPESGGGSTPSPLHPSGWKSCACSPRGDRAMGFLVHQLLLQLPPPPWLFLCCSLFSLGLADGCPAPCRCLGELVDCSRLKLSRVPESLPAWIEQL